jgi:hypothetical protein
VGGSPISTSHDLSVGALGCGEFEELDGLVDRGLAGSLWEEVRGEVCAVGRGNALAGDAAGSSELETIADAGAGRDSLHVDNQQLVCGTDGENVRGSRAQWKHERR